MDEIRFSVERVLEIGRDFQHEDRMHGAHWDTAKLLCDTIEELYAEVKKCHKALKNLNEMTEQDWRPILGHFMEPREEADVKYIHDCHLCKNKRCLWNGKEQKNAVVCQEWIC